MRRASSERLVERVEHDGWRVEQVTAPLGVVGVRVRGPAQRVRRRRRGDPRRQHRGVPDRLGRARHRPGDRRACAAARPFRRRPAARRGRAAREPRARGGLGDVLRPPRGAGRGARVRPGDRPARRGGAPGRRAGVAARHGRRLDDRGRRRRRRALRRRRHRLAGPQGLQHAERLRAWSAARACCPLFWARWKRRANAAGTAASCTWSAATTGCPEAWTGARTCVRRADGDHDEPLVERLDESRARDRVGVGGDAGSQRWCIVRRARRGRRALQPLQPAVHPSR